MQDQLKEIPLSGGNVNAGVVKVGNTVRRQMSAHSQSVHRLLKHLESKGYPHSPRLLGIDQNGREKLSYLTGSTDFPGDIWEEEYALVSAVNMLKTYHAALEDFEVLPTDSWAFRYPDANRHEVVCHNDFAPYNMVFNQGQATGILDFDLAGPGPKLRDLAYLAYWFVPFSFSSSDMSQFALREFDGNLPRFRLLCSTYCTGDYLSLLEFVSEVLAHMGNKNAATEMVGPEAALRLEEGGHFAHWNREFRAFEDIRPRIESRLA